MNIRKNTTEVFAELMRISKANRGNLTPEAVLKNARSESSPIHDRFTWDNTVAGERYRLIEAAMLIRTVKVSVEMHDQDDLIVTRAFVNVASNARDRDDDTCASGVYVPIEVALKVDDYRTQMLENAGRELGAFRRKYAVLKEMAGVFEAIDRLQLQLT